MSSVPVDAPHARWGGTANRPVHFVPHSWVPQSWFASAFEQALAWLERARQRRELRQLSDHMLKDIGLTRADVEAEAAKPFWRA